MDKIFEWYLKMIGVVFHENIPRFCDSSVEFLVGSEDLDLRTKL